jgi:hypothetical protein
LNQADITAKTQPKECCLNIQDLQIVQVIFARLLKVEIQRLKVSSSGWLKKR